MAHNQVPEDAFTESVTHLCKDVPIAECVLLVTNLRHEMYQHQIGKSDQILVILKLVTIFRTQGSSVAIL